jgi:hypothetical protein
MMSAPIQPPPAKRPFAAPTGTGRREGQHIVFTSSMAKSKLLIAIGDCFLVIGQSECDSFALDVLILAPSSVFTFMLK